jgi:hypothetical protein
MVQSDMDPCVFYKIYESEIDEHGNGGLVTDYLIVITWVDDCRYFGTSKLVNEYERVIRENCKCTFEGKSKDQRKELYLSPLRTKGCSRNLVKQRSRRGSICPILTS